jgi:ribosomal protein L29
MAQQGTRAHELDDMNATDLEARLREAKEELFNLRFQVATGQLDNNRRLHHDGLVHLVGDHVATTALAVTALVGLLGLVVDLLGHLASSSEVVSAVFSADSAWGRMPSSRSRSTV